jgi:hypothetical protein
MFRRDYILNMIEQIGILLSHVFNKSISNEAVETRLEALSDQWIGLPLSMLLSLPVEEVYRLFEESERMVIEKSYLMADICRVKGTISPEKSIRHQYFEKALYFYGKCSGSDDEKLQQEIDKYSAELTARIKEE